MSGLVLVPPVSVDMCVYQMMHLTNCGSVVAADVRDYTNSSSDVVLRTFQGDPKGR